MATLIVNSFEELSALIGQELGVSDYFQITQKQINLFAEATLDYQWIHVDPEKAKIESPFKNTIAHGYLTLSLLPYLWNQIIEVRNQKLQVNYGIEKFKFSQPVLVNDRVRLAARLIDVKNLRGVAKAKIKISLEIEGSKKPAYDGEAVFLYHFN